MKRKVLWLVYRKLRPALGIPFAFTLMTGVFLGVFSYDIILIALGFFFIDLFGNFCNDYWDYLEDVRNGRQDKFTTSGIISKRRTLYISILYAFVGVLILFYHGLLLGGLGALYTLLLFIYSHKTIHLKGKLIGYAVVSFPYILLPIFIAYGRGFSIINALPLSLFFYFQCIYILCQKDSTDMKDDSNLFIANGWKKSVNITTFFGISASVSLLLLSILNPILLLVWLFNVLSKFINLEKIRKKSITRAQRKRYVLLEFLAPYLYIMGEVII